MPGLNLNMDWPSKGGYFSFFCAKICENSVFAQLCL